MTLNPVRELDGIAFPQAGTFVLDPAHTRVGFVARHLMVTKVRGAFPEVEGTVVVAADPLESTATATIQTGSIATGSADRDAHLRSADFFDVEQYPTMSFASTSVRRDGDGFEVTGDLTIKDVTREVVLEVEVDGVATDPWGNEKVGITARTTVDREDWGLTWNVALESGGVLVSKKVTLEIEAQLLRQAPQA